MPNDPYTDDEYDDTYKEVHGDEPTRDRYTNEGTDDTFFPSGAGGSLFRSGRGLWPGGTTGDAADAYEDGDQYDGREAVGAEDDENGSWWDEGLIGTILLVGFVLFVIPEPATSGIGILLLATGVVLWIIDWLA